MKPPKKKPFKVLSPNRWSTTYSDHSATTKTTEAHSEDGFSLQTNRIETTSHLEGEHKTRIGDRVQETNLDTTQQRPLHLMQMYQFPWISIAPTPPTEEGPLLEDEPPKIPLDKQLTIPSAFNVARWDILLEIVPSIESNPRDVSRNGLNKFPFQINFQSMTRRQQPPQKTE